MRLSLLLSLVVLQGCFFSKKKETMNIYAQYRTQKIEERDSIFVIYTLKEWSKDYRNNWGVRTDMYKLTSDDVDYFIGGTFYSPDKKKMMIWVGEKEPNADTWEKYSEDPKTNRICPTGGDTIFSMSALIGIRDSVTQIWKLYPFDQQQATCCATKERAINILGQYYFEKMKTHEMYRMIQSGTRKGYLEGQAYGYNLQDKDFWNKCWLWQKDTVGSYDLYPFQIYGYNYVREKCTHKCADPLKLPIIEYPQEILQLYENH